jgi:Domain of unknown function (DUF1833)
VPRVVSADALKSALAQNTDEVWVCLLEINHASLSEPIFLCNDNVNTSSTVATGSAKTFIAFPFEATLPAEEAEQEPRVRLTVSNVDLRLVTLIRSITGGPTVRLWLVLAGSPNVAEYGPVKLRANSVTINADVVQMDLGVDAYTGEPIPWASFTPEYFPGLFNADFE